TGTLTVNSSSPGGCPTRVCTTNLVTTTHCYTNCYWKLVCETNGGTVRCTNVLVCTERCFTNTFPEITCTNQFLTPTSVNLRETLTAALGVNRGCDELDGLFPSNAVLQINLSSNLRSNDWRGAHAGIFKILDGTNIIAYGAASGANGVGSHRGL